MDTGWDYDVIIKVVDAATALECLSLCDAAGFCAGFRFCTTCPTDNCNFYNAYNPRLLIPLEGYISGPESDRCP